MGYFQVRYDSRVVNYDRRGFIRLATGQILLPPYSFFVMSGSLAPLFIMCGHTVKLKPISCLLNWMSMGDSNPRHFEFISPPPMFWSKLKIWIFWKNQNCYSIISRNPSAHTLDVVDRFVVVVLVFVADLVVVVVSASQSNFNYVLTKAAGVMKLLHFRIRVQNKMIGDLVIWTGFFIPFVLTKWLTIM